MADYDSVPLTELRGQLGSVFDGVSASGRPVIVTREGKELVAVVPAEILRHAALPPAYFNDDLREQILGRLDDRIKQHSAEDIAEAEAKLSKVMGALDGTSASRR
ncbi:type II toxin-antitoxin system Phd/YefM family antitoxin [Nocardia rosealba]|uniref:type II toxin-antitoxin system Phd/YefM family antitoxin n=1 Tax=Nocardia rosealba TaxID=2878563 RepID=UPI001CD97E32|nr:type II toxin-antitoxin system prevent-host-death family antitoxin [Nocardia rosealba]MCA2206429.1 type II toxin-antitoxin system Phd/YefM family antitoxin [Nocardia rosealba]